MADSPSAPQTAEILHIRSCGRPRTRMPSLAPPSNGHRQPLGASGYSKAPDGRVEAPKGRGPTRRVGLALAEVPLQHEPPGVHQHRAVLRHRPADGRTSHWRRGDFESRGPLSGAADDPNAFAGPNLTHFGRRGLLQALREASRASTQPFAAGTFAAGPGGPRRPRARRAWRPTRLSRRAVHQMRLGPLKCYARENSVQLHY